MIGELGLTYDEAYAALQRLCEDIRQRKKPHECINNADEHTKPYISFLVGLFLGMTAASNDPHLCVRALTQLSKAVNGDEEALKEILNDTDLE